MRSGCRGCHGCHGCHGRHRAVTGNRPLKPIDEHWREVRHARPFSFPRWLWRIWAPTSVSSKPPCGDEVAAGEDRAQVPGRESAPRRRHRSLRVPGRGIRVPRQPRQREQFRRLHRVRATACDQPSACPYQGRADLANASRARVRCRRRSAKAWRRASRATASMTEFPISPDFERHHRLRARSVPLASGSRSGCTTCSCTRRACAPSGT